MAAPYSESHSYPSYSQAGEDRILYFLFESLGSPRNLRYADIGAAAPAGHNNTFLFYTLGGRGVLVEADPKYRDAYAAVRPGDLVEQVAVVPASLAQGGTVTFHAMENAGWSTVSAKHVEVATSLNKGNVQYSIRVPCMTINELLGRHFPDGKLDILSLDIEGVDTQVLAELDLTRFSPTAIVVESPVGAPGDASDRAPCLTQMRAAGYEVYACSFVNYVYVHTGRLRGMRV